MIKIREVISKRDLKKFILLPYEIHKNHKEWLPPLISDEWKVYDKTKNHSFDHCDTVLLLAEKGNKVVGRIMGIINHLYNNGHNEKNARFCFMETYDDKEVFDALITAIEDWAKNKSMEKLVGPLGFSDKDPQGFLVEGFSDPISVMVTNCSYEYMIKHTERNGFTKKLDLFQYRAPMPKETPEFYLKVAERVKKRGFKILEFNKSKNLRPYVPGIFDLINQTYTDIYGFAALDKREATEFSERFLPLLNAEYIKIVTDENEKMVAFVVAMPDISKGLKKANGRLFPFGFIHILKDLKKSKQLNLLLGCVTDNFRNSGIDALMAASLIQSAINNNLSTIDSHLIMEENTSMRAEIERFDGYKIYKKYRIFEKEI